MNNKTYWIVVKNRTMFADTDLEKINNYLDDEQKDKKNEVMLKIHLGIYYFKALFGIFLRSRS